MFANQYPHSKCFFFLRDKVIFRPKQRSKLLFSAGLFFGRNGCVFLRENDRNYSPGVEGTDTAPPPVSRPIKAAYLHKAWKLRIDRANGSINIHVWQSLGTSRPFVCKEGAFHLNMPGSVSHNGSSLLQDPSQETFLDRSTDTRPPLSLFPSPYLLFY